VCAVDVGDGAALAGAIEGVIKDHGRLDILVNNAGITRDNLLLRMSDEEFDEVMNVNLRSAFVACRAAAAPR
jgi:3-oxoacyl-[acyl-carrier protein] reductase